ncbi:hypothetical protein D3C87_2074810 [compost metagenome]
MTVLTATARLTDELTLDLDLLADRLTVRDLRLTDVGVHLELAKQTVDDDLQVELAHAGDQGLRGLGIVLHAEGRILFGQLLQGDA